jgi:cytochrome P450
MLSSKAGVLQNVPPPVVKGLPLLGNAIPMLRNPLRFLRETHKQYGDVYAVKAAHLSFVVMAGIEANRFLAERSDEFLSSTGFWKDTLVEMECPHSFIAVDGEPHQYQRTLMKPMFAKSAFACRIPELATIFRDTFAAQYGRKTLVSPFVRQGFSRQIGGCLQGYEPTSREVEALMHYQTTAMNVGALKKWPRFALRTRKYRTAKRIVTELADRIIASKTPEGNPTRYIDVLVDNGLKDHPQWFTPGDIRNHAIISFLAGIDTMGATLSFMLREFFRQPLLRHKLQQEVDRAWVAGVPSLEVLEGLGTLQNFMKEVLRLYPTAYALRRTAVCDFVFQGHQIRRGQDILLFTTSNHTDAAHFQNPDEFDIERYNPPRSEHLTRHAFVPFGKGPHSCIGAGLATILLPLNFGLMLHHLDLSPACNLRKVKLDFYNPTAALSRHFGIRMLPRGSSPAL